MLNVSTQGFEVRTGRLWTQIEATFKQTDTSEIEHEASVEILNNKHIFNRDYPNHVLFQNTYTIHKILYIDHQYSNINNNKTSRAFTH